MTPNLGEYEARGWECLEADDKGLACYLIKKSKGDDCWIDIEVSEIYGWVDDGTGEYVVPCRIEGLFTATVKWDGCSHVNFGDDGYLHLCGRIYWEALARILPKAFAWAKARIPHYDATVGG
jgi:hypothetical protein